jgi:hypothetical protein
MSFGTLGQLRSPCSMFPDLSKVIAKRAGALCSQEEILTERPAITPRAPNSNSRQKALKQRVHHNFCCQRSGPISR